MTDESQNRIDSIIALIMEEARNLKNPTYSQAQYPRSKVYHVLMKVRERVMKIMRTME